jgi:hypothetical protein
MLPVITSTSTAPSASVICRSRGGNIATKNATPTLSPRASAPAAPKKLSATISPRATSSAQAQGESSMVRDSTDATTTSRSAASSNAAAASVSRSSGFAT